MIFSGVTHIIESMFCSDEGTNLDNGLYPAILVDLHSGVLRDHNDCGLLAQNGELVVANISSQCIHAARLLVTRECIVGSVKGVHVRPSKDHGSTCMEKYFVK